MNKYYFFYFYFFKDSRIETGDMSNILVLLPMERASLVLSINHFTEISQHMDSRVKYDFDEILCYGRNLRLKLKYNVFFKNLN